MELKDIAVAEPLKWGEFLRLLVGAEGFLLGVAMLTTVAALVDTGITWLLGNVWPSGWRQPGDGQRKLITAAVPFGVVALASLFGALGGYFPADGDTIFGGVQVAGAVAFGGVLTRTGIQAIQGMGGGGSKEKVIVEQPAAPLADTRPLPVREVAG